jgi:hypothetical protein
MRTAKSKFERKGLRFYLRFFSVFLFLGILGTLGIFLIPCCRSVVAEGRKAGDFCLQDPRDQDKIVLSELLEKKKQSFSSSWAPNACSTINTSPS